MLGRMGTAVLLLTLLGGAPAPARPAVDWSAFPEGRTVLRLVSCNAKRPMGLGLRQYVVTRTGARVVVEAGQLAEPQDCHGVPSVDAATWDGLVVTRFEAASLATPAVGADGALSFSCARRTVVVHSADLGFKRPPGEPSCEGEAEVATSRAPKRREVQWCQVFLDGEALFQKDAALVFAPKVLLERVSLDNDCTVANALRLAPAK
jgi:hypothetical protein